MYSCAIKPFCGVNIHHRKKTLKLWSEKIQNHSCSVEMIKSFLGNLKITRGDKVVFETLVDLDFHAEYNSNYHDIEEWKKICISYMENHKIPELTIV